MNILCVCVKLWGYVWLVQLARNTWTQAAVSTLMEAKTQILVSAEGKAREVEKEMKK